MDIRPPKPPEESFTITKAKWIEQFSKIVGAISGAVVLLDQAGATALLPAKIQKYVTPGVLGIGLIALCTGNVKQASALIADRSGKPDIFTQTGKPGRNKQDALMQVFMSVAELELARKANSGELVPANTAQKQAQFEEKILGRLEEFKPVTFPADVPAALPVVPAGVIIPTPKPGLAGVGQERKHSLSDLATIAQRSL
jgi:hypothetical protein